MTWPLADDPRPATARSRTRRGVQVVELIHPRQTVLGATEGVAGLCWFVLLLRLAATLMLVISAVLIDPQPARLAIGTVIVVVTLAEIAVLTRSPVDRVAGDGARPGRPRRRHRARGGAQACHAGPDRPERDRALDRGGRAWPDGQGTARLGWKTPRGISFAAMALPASVRRRPELVEELAATVAQGAQTAADEARELLGTLRSDDLEAELDESLTSISRAWSARCGVPVTLDLTPVEVELPLRHELARITREAFGNIARHAGAGRVWVVAEAERTGLPLVIQDDGAGFSVPDGLSELVGAGHYRLVGMAERAAGVGGRPRVWSDPGGSTQIVIRASRIVEATLGDAVQR